MTETQNTQTVNYFGVYRYENLIGSVKVTKVADFDTLAEAMDRQAEETCETPRKDRYSKVWFEVHNRTRTEKVVETSKWRWDLPASR